jgi:hypothetical protein
MTRRRRRFAAWFGILGIAFAQFAVTAHACLTGAVVHATAAKAVAMAHEGHCAGVQAKAPLAPVSNACEVQCTDGAPSAAAPDLPPVLQAVLPVAPPAVLLPFSERAVDVAALAAASAQPPPQLQFGRFLN